MKAECPTPGTVTATNLVRFRQKLEGQQTEPFGDKEYSLSFWFKSNVNGVYTAMLRNNLSVKNSPVSFTVSDNNWHFTTMVRSGDNLYLYTDGVLEGSTTGVNSLNVDTIDETSTFSIVFSRL